MFPCGLRRRASLDRNRGVDSTGRQCIRVIRPRRYSLELEQFVTSWRSSGLHLHQIFRPLVGEVAQRSAAASGSISSTCRRPGRNRAIKTAFCTLGASSSNAPAATPSSVSRIPLRAHREPISTSRQCRRDGVYPAVHENLSLTRRAGSVSMRSIKSHGISRGGTRRSKVLRTAAGITPFSRRRTAPAPTSTPPTLDGTVCALS